MTGFSSVTKVKQRRASIKVAGGDYKRRSKLHTSIGRLCNFDELPEWQKDNDHIRTGYVRETNSILRCIQSMLYFNNESFNIYSHLFPSLTYFALLCLFTDAVIVPLFPGTTVRDCVIINLYLLGSCLCLGCSTFFHCLKQHSESHSKIWSKIDYVGIIIQITCSIISLLYYGYYDHIRLFQLFTAITLCLGTVCTIFVLHERFNQVDFRPFRATCFVVFGFSGLLPVMIGTLKIGFEWLTRIQIKYVLLEAVFYVSGAIIYGFRIPEMFAPGWFDYVGHSHQIFHIMVVLGSICHFRAVIGSFVFVRTGKHYPGLLMLG